MLYIFVVDEVTLIIRLVIITHAVSMYIFVFINFYFNRFNDISKMV